MLGLLCAKPQYGAVAALWLILIRQPRALVGFAAGGAGLLGLSLLWGGVAPWAAWIDFVTGPHLHGYGPLPWRSLSLPAVLSLPLRGWGHAVAAGRILSIVALAAALVLALRRGRTPAAHRDWTLHAGLILSALLLALPHMMDYDLGMHGLLLCALLPRLRGRALWLLAFVALSPLFGEASRLLHVAIAPLLLCALAVHAARLPFASFVSPDRRQSPP